MMFRDLFQTSAPDVAVEIDHAHVAAARLSWRGSQAVISAHASENLPAGLVVPGLAATMLRADVVAPVSFVEQVVQAAFAFHVLTGMAIVAGLATMFFTAWSLGTYCCVSLGMRRLP